MTGSWHYRTAQLLAAMIDTCMAEGDTRSICENCRELATLAQVHATLAVAAASVHPFSVIDDGWADVFNQDPTETIT